MKIWSWLHPGQPCWRCLHLIVLWECNEKSNLSTWWFGYRRREAGSGSACPAPHIGWKDTSGTSHLDSTNEHLGTMTFLFTKTIWKQIYCTMGYSKINATLILEYRATKQNRLQNWRIYSINELFWFKIVLNSRYVIYVCTLLDMFGYLLLLTFSHRSILIKPLCKNIVYVHYIAKSIGSPPFNERFDYFGHFKEYKS